MTLETVVVAAVSGIVGAVLGGFLNAQGAILATKKSLASAESQEIRKQKVLCLVQLMGHRYVIGNENATAEMKAPIHVALNTIPALFVSSEVVMAKYRAFRQSTSNATLVELIKVLDTEVGLGISKLDANDIETVLKL